MVRTPGCSDPVSFVSPGEIAAAEVPISLWSFCTLSPSSSPRGLVWPCCGGSGVAAVFGVLCFDLAQGSLWLAGGGAGAAGPSQRWSALVLLEEVAWLCPFIVLGLVAARRATPIFKTGGHLSSRLCGALPSSSPAVSSASRSGGRCCGGSAVLTSLLLRLCRVRGVRSCVCMCFVLFVVEYMPYFSKKKDSIAQSQA